MPTNIACIGKIHTAAARGQDFRYPRRRNTIANQPANPLFGLFHRPFINELR